MIKSALYVSRQPGGLPEIFQSIQGEGISMGSPAVFLRLALCNLKCSWCDTKYTWDWEHYDKKKEVIKMSISDVQEGILAFGCKHLVITGGEPLIQQNDFGELLANLKGNGFYIEVETNGTVTPNYECINSVDRWNVSPKLRNSDNPLALREVAEAYNFFASYTKANFKYVIQSKKDIIEVKNLTDKYCIDRRKIILMPKADSRASLNKRSKWLARICIQNNYMFSNRLQILLWNNRRGC